MFFGMDPLYLLISAPGMLLAAWAQSRVSSAFAEGSRYPSRLTGAEGAAAVMQSEGLANVAIEPVRGHLTDHYDPKSKVLRLSEPVYAGQSLASLGVAAHEAGHAIQDAHHDARLVLRNFLVPAANLGSSAAWIVFFIGMALYSTKLMLAGIILFSLMVLFQLVNLPVEFDASRRARNALQMTGMISQDEDRVVGHVLNAAALTYVAGTLTSILTLVYFILRSGLLGGGGDRREDY